MKVSVAPKPFFQGLAVAALLYLLLLAFLWQQGPAAMKRLEESLASASAPIQYIARVEEAPAPLEPLPARDLDQPLAAQEPIPAPQTPAASETTSALTPAPIDGLYEKTAQGLLPKPSADGSMTPFDSYRRPFTPSGKPAIAILLDDYGLSESASQKALEGLPPAVSFLLSPYSATAQSWADSARGAGHELWMKVNFETAAYPNSDPGPQALLANASLKYNEDRLLWTLSRASGYTGVAGATDSVFESAASILQPLVKDVYKRGLGFLETNDLASPMIETLAVKAQAPYARSDLVLNETRDGTELALTRLESLAREHGYAIGVLKPYDSSFDALRLWLASLPAKGIELAPVSAVAALPLMGGAPEEEEVIETPSSAAP